MGDLLQRVIRYRPTLVPTSGIPFGVRSWGRYRVDSRWAEDFEGRSFAEVFHGVQGIGTITCGNQDFVLDPGKILVVPPGIDQHIRTSSKIWEYEWYTIDGSLGGTVLEWCTLDLGLYAAEAWDRAIFQALGDQILDPGIQSQKTCAAYGFRLLTAIPSDVPSKELSNPVRQTLRLIHRRFGDPQVSISAIADEVGIHRSQLSRTFRKERGTSPSEYLEEVRLQTAASLLSDTGLSVAEVARRCGYRDPNYFSRDFRRWFGVSPRNFRKGV